MTTPFFITPRKFLSDGTVTDGYDLFNTRTDGVDILFAADINAVATSLQELERALLDGYATTKLLAQSSTYGGPSFQDGQTLVYSAATTQLVPGASGDASFKVQSVTNPNAVLKSGYLILNDGRELNLATDTTVNLTTAAGGGSPADGYYYVYVDLTTLPAQTTVAGRKIYAITASMFSAQTTTPESINQSRYVPIGLVNRASASWSSSNFATLAVRRHEKSATAASPVAYSLAQQAVGSVGSSGQIAAGHILTSLSFPVDNSKVSWFNLTNANDGSGAGRNLTNNNSTPFTGTNILGTINSAAVLNGTNQTLSSTATFFNPGNTNFSYGGWFKATTWVTGSEQALMGQWNSGSDRGFNITISSTGYLSVAGATGVSNSNVIVASSVSAAGLVNSQWAFFVVTYAASTNVYTLYVNGNSLGSGNNGGAQVTVGTPTFRIGAYATTALSFFAGSVEDVFFVNGATLTDEDVHKLYATRLDHNANVAVTDQRWSATFQRADGYVTDQLDFGYIVDMERNSLFADFSSFSSTEKISLKLENTAVSATVVPTKTYDTGYVAANSLTFPLTHGLGAIPTAVQLQHDTGSGAYENVEPGNHITVSTTQIAGSLAAFGSDLVRIVASAAPDAVSLNLSSTSGDIIPSLDNTYNLGSTTNRWASVHVGPGSLQVHNDTTNTQKLSINYVTSDAYFTTDSTSGMRWKSGTTDLGAVSTAGAWTLGPSSFAGNHVFNGNIGVNITNPAGLAVGLGKALAISDSNGGLLSLRNTNGGNTTAELSAYTGSNGFFLDFTGQTTGTNNTLSFRNNSTNNSNSVTVVGKIDSAGTWTVGPTGAKTQVGGNTGSTFPGNLIVGKTNGSTVAAGYVAEKLEDVTTSAVTLGNGGAANCASKVFTPGLWLIWGWAEIQGGTQITQAITCITTTSGVLSGSRGTSGVICVTTGSASDFQLSTPPQIFNFSTNTTVYNVCRATFGGGTVTSTASVTGIRIA